MFQIGISIDIFPKTILKRCEEEGISRKIINYMSAEARGFYYSRRVVRNSRKVVESQVTDLITAGKSLKEISILLNISVKTVRDLMPQEAFSLYSRKKHGKEVNLLILEGKSLNEISKLLNISVNTARYHMSDEAKEFYTAKKSRDDQKSKMSLLHQRVTDRLIRKSPSRIISVDGMSEIRLSVT